MATVVGAPVGSGSIAQNFANAGQGINSGIQSIISGFAQRQGEQKRQQDLQLLMQTLNPQALEQNAPGVSPPAPQPQIDLSQLSGLQTPGFQNLASQMLIQKASGQGGFTLGPGDQRFTQGGQLQASGPPLPVSATQQIAQGKLDAINNLKAKVKAGTATKADKKLLNKFLGGGSAVEVNIGKTTGAERTAIAETNASLDALGNLETLFDDPETGTGPVKGRVDPIIGLAGLTTQKQENLLAATSAFKNAVIKDITGAQMSEPEAKRIMQQIPLATDPPKRWKAKAKQTRRNLEMLQKRRSEVLQRSGIIDPSDRSQALQDGAFGVSGAGLNQGVNQQQAAPSFTPEEIEAELKRRGL